MNSLALSSSLTQRTWDWASWKSVQAQKSGIFQSSSDDRSYVIWFYDGPEVHICSLARDGLNPGQSDGDVADFETNYLPKANATLVSMANGKPRVANEKPLVSRTNFYSHDWTDPTTWYQQSTEIVNEVPTAIDASTYQLAKPFVIDLYHGKVTLEDQLVDPNGHSYRVQVTVNGTVKHEQDPHFGAGGDFTVDYTAGKILFLSALQPSDVVNVTYHYPNMTAGNGVASRFTFAPAAGKKITLSVAECQFSLDVDPLDTIQLEIWGIADFFLPPATMTALGIAAGAGTKIMLQRFTYKSMSDFQNDAFKAYPTYPVLGKPTNWRSQTQPVTVFDWDYIASACLQSSKGMEMRSYLQHDHPFDGWMATATFYCTSEADV